MGSKTKIEWTRSDDGTEGASWNPVEGCQEVSPGCRNCYAKQVAARYSGPGQYYHGIAIRTGDGKAHWTHLGRVNEKHMLDPIRWTKPKRIFVNSMSDLFWDEFPDEVIERVFAVMALSPHHTFILLTKREKRMRAWFDRMVGMFWQNVRGMIHRIVQSFQGTRLFRKMLDREKAVRFPLPNVWVGVSAENQEWADRRVPELLAIPAAVRFISYEPALGPIDFTNMPTPSSSSWHQWSGTYNALTGRFGLAVGDYQKEYEFSKGVVPEVRLDWIIAGSESGPGARPAAEDWYRSVRDQCEAAGVAFFLKQKAEKGRKVSLPVLDGRQHIEWPEGVT